MNPLAVPNLNGRKPLPASGPFWASAASMNETGLGRPNAAPAHAAVNRALRRVRFNIAFSFLFLGRRELLGGGRGNAAALVGRSPTYFWVFCFLLPARPPPRE